MSKDLIPVPIKNDDGTTTEINIVLKNPSNEVIAMSERYRAKIFNQCLMDGILTKPELSRMMTERGLWDKDKDAKHDELTNQIIELEKDLYLGKGSVKERNEDTGKKIAIKMRQLRIELRDLIAQKVQLEENTAESIADNAKFDFLVAFCTYHENGEKVYKNIDDYNLKSSDAISFVAASKLAEMMYNIDPNFEKSLPENKWLTGRELVDEDGNLVNEKGQKVDIDGRLINDNGEFINDDGHRVDRDGNLLDEDGTYIAQVEYIKDNPKPTPKKKTTRSRKRTAKTDSTT